MDWSKQYGLDDDRDAYLGVDMYINFKKDVWFMLLKSMWKKHQSVFQDHVKYIHSDIVKPFWVGILHCNKQVQEMQYLAKYIPSPSMKGETYNSDNWDAY